MNTREERKIVLRDLAGAVGHERRRYIISDGGEICFAILVTAIVVENAVCVRLAIRRAERVALVVVRRKFLFNLGDHLQVRLSAAVRRRAFLGGSGELASDTRNHVFHVCARIRAFASEDLTERVLLPRGTHGSGRPVVAGHSAGLAAEEKQRPRGARRGFRVGIPTGSRRRTRGRTKQRCEFAARLGRQQLAFSGAGTARRDLARDVLNFVLIECAALPFGIDDDGDVAPLAVRHGLVGGHHAFAQRDVGIGGTVGEEAQGSVQVRAAAPKAGAFGAHELHAPSEFAERGDGLRPGEAFAFLRANPSFHGERLIQHGALQARAVRDHAKRAGTVEVHRRVTLLLLEASGRRRGHRRRHGRRRRRRWQGRGRGRGRGRAENLNRRDLRDIPEDV